MAQRGAKYQPLHDFLRRTGKEAIELSFAELERILGTKLPPSARASKAFWSNRGRGALQARAWMEAGYHVTQVDLDAERVRFERPRLRYAVPVIQRADRWNADMVRALRVRCGLTQAQLADMLGVRQQTVSEWERGAYRPTRARSKHLSLVAEQLGFFRAPGKDELDSNDGTV